MYKYVAKDGNFKTIAVEIEHNQISALEGGGDGYYYHLSEDGYNFVKTAQETMPQADGYLLYSSITGTPYWAEQEEAIVDHALLSNIQGGSFAEGYYHFTQQEHEWIVEAYTDGYWDVSKGGTGITSYSPGDIIYADSALTLTTLPIGSEDQILKVIGGVPSWQTLVISTTHNSLEGIQGGEVDGYYHLTSLEHTWLTDGSTLGYWEETKGGTGNVSYVAGDILYADGANSLAALPIGTAEQVLQVVGSAPSWQTLIHNNLYGLQGGETDGYYHLEFGEHTWLTDGYNLGYWVESQGGTGETSYNQGDILVGDGSNGLTVLPKGIDGYQLTVVGNSLDWTPGYYNVVFVGKVGSVSSSLDGYMLSNLAISSTEDFPAFLVPIKSKVRGLRVRMAQPPGAGEDVIVTVRNAETDTELTVTIVDTDITGTNVTSTIVVNPGAYLTVRIETSSGATVEDISASFLLYPDNSIA